MENRLSRLRSTPGSLRATSSPDILVNNAAIDPQGDVEPDIMHSSRFDAFPVPQW